MTLIEIRRDTAANWTARNPVLRLGEPGLDTTDGVLKFGDGVTAWAGLVGAPATGAALTAAVTAAIAALYSTPTDVASLGAGVTQGTPTFQSYTGPGSMVYLQGQIQLAAATYNAGTVFATLPAGQWPARGPAVIICRTGPASTATQTNLEIDSATGQISTLSQITAATTETINFDGMSFRHA